MQPLKAQVLNGRIVVDEPTDLPEGTQVYLVAADDGDDLDDEERAALELAIEEGLADARAGRHEDAFVVMERLQLRRENKIHKPR